MKVVLERLTMNNFKGIDHLELEPRGKDMDIYGDNATGKTTIFDAFHWVLFGKDSAGRTDFEILPLGTDGKVADHDVVATATAELVLGSETVELRKEYLEKWTRKRGQLDAEFSGHTTRYIVNGVEVPKAKYNAFVAGIIDEELFRLLTNPFYFNTTLSWQKRRKMLVDMACCEPAPAPEIIAVELEKMTPEALNDQLVRECHQLEADAVAKTTLAKELEKGLPAAAADVSALEARLLEIEAEHKAATAKMFEVVKGLSAEVDKHREAEEEWRKKSQELCTENEAYNKRCSKEYADAMAKWHSECRARDIGLSELKAANEADTRTIKELSKKAEVLRQEWRRVREQEWVPGTHCDTCGSAITEEAFKKARAAELDRLRAEGKACVAEIDVITQRMDERNPLFDKFEVMEINMPVEPEYGLPYFAERMAEIERHIKEAASARMKAADELTRAQVPHKELPAEWYEIKNRIAEELNAGQNRVKVEELRKQVSDLRLDHDLVCAKLDALHDYIRDSIEAAEKTINSHFRLVRFQLFDELVNGEVKETCVASVNGVPYSDLNSAMKINAGLDIINGYGAAYNRSMPIFVDNAESVTKLIETDSQVIRLVVSEEDKELRIEQE